MTGKSWVSQPEIGESPGGRGKSLGKFWHFWNTGYPQLC